MKISRKARKLLSVVLTVVLAIGTFQFAPGVRTIAKAADAPEAGQSYTLNFAKAFSEKTQLNGYTSEAIHCADLILKLNRKFVF